MKSLTSGRLFVLLAVVWFTKDIYTEQKKAIKAKAEKLLDSILEIESLETSDNEPRGGFTVSINWYINKCDNKNTTLLWHSLAFLILRHGW